MNEFERYIELVIEQFPDADIRRCRDSNVSVEFPETGWGVDIFYGSGSYGFGKGLIELAVLKNGHMHYENPVAQGDVRGYLTADEALEFTKKVSEWDYSESFIGWIIDPDDPETAWVKGDNPEELEFKYKSDPIGKVISKKETD